MNMANKIKTNLLYYSVFSIYITSITLFQRNFTKLQVFGFKTFFPICLLGFLTSSTRDTDEKSQSTFSFQSNIAILLLLLYSFLPKDILLS